MSGAKGTPVVEVKDLNISFKTAAGVIKVVENVSFSIGKGECLAVVGESGSGKSVSALATIGLLVRINQLSLALSSSAARSCLASRSLTCARFVGAASP